MREITAVLRLLAQDQVEELAGIISESAPVTRTEAQNLASDLLSHVDFLQTVHGESTPPGTLPVYRAMVLRQHGLNVEHGTGFGVAWSIYEDKAIPYDALGKPVPPGSALYIFAAFAPFTSVDWAETLRRRSVNAHYYEHEITLRSGAPLQLRGWRELLLKNDQGGRVEELFPENEAYEPDDEPEWDTEDWDADTARDEIVKSERWVAHPMQIVAQADRIESAIQTAWRNLTQNDPYTQQELSSKYTFGGGECGVFALALADALGEGELVCLVGVENEEDLLDGDWSDTLSEFGISPVIGEPRELLHVALRVNGRLYDGSGRVQDPEFSSWRVDHEVTELVVLDPKDPDVRDAVLEATGPERFTVESLASLLKEVLDA